MVETVEKCSICLNGKLEEIPRGITLLEFLGAREEGLAVAYNRKFVPRKAYATTILSEGDELEIVTPHPGG